MKSESNTDLGRLAHGGDAYEYRGTTFNVDLLIEALDNLEKFQAGGK